MKREQIEEKYDEFFGTGYWEVQYKKHIVEFVFQCSNSGKPMLGGAKPAPLPLPFPWRFRWADAPKIVASNGATVCVISTGTIDGPYSEDDIVTTARLLSSGNGT